MVGTAGDHGNGGHTGVGGNHTPFHLGGVPFGPTVRGGTFSQAFQVGEEAELGAEADDEKSKPEEKIFNLRESDRKATSKEEHHGKIESDQ